MLDTAAMLELLLLLDCGERVTGDVTPETGRGEPVAIGDIAPDIGLGEAATGGCEPDQEVLETGVNEPDDRGPRGELLNSVASICAMKFF